MNPSSPPLSPAPGQPNRRRVRFGWLAAGWLLALVALDTRLPNPAGQPPRLEVEMDSSVSSVAQAFFDTGEGFSQAQSSTQPIAAGPAPRTVVFPLPAKTVRAIRFDPLTVPGTVHLHSAAIRRADNHGDLATIDLRQITGLNEIERLTPQPDGLEVVTTPTSGDSQLSLPVPTRIDTRPDLMAEAVHWVGVDASITMLTLIAAGLLWFLGPRCVPLVRPVLAPLRWLDTRFASWAERLSSPEIARLDRWIFWFYGGCALFFGALAAAGIHGSSLDEYASKYDWSGVKAAPLLGTAREIRSDEWAQQTPAFLNQAFRRDAYAAKTSAFGGQDAAVLYSVPCRDFTQVFRPQFWPFHFLPIAAAFPLYWQAKGFFLLTGVFSLLLLLTRGQSGLAALGALWFFFSAHIQWAYSWPSMLPEMIGCFGWAICLTLYLTIGRDRYLLAAAAIGCAIAALDFALCFYPPHQIPLVLFGVALTAVWLRMHRVQVFRREQAGRRILALTGCWVVVLVVLAGFYLETRAGIATATHTVYPGQRVVSGGGIPLEEYLSHFLDFWKTEDFFPSAQGNVCEGTGFLWLLPVTLVMLARARSATPTGGEATLAACWLVASLVAAWTIFPVPAGVGHWLLFDHVPASRCLPALGLINVTGVVVYLSLRRKPVDSPAQPLSFWRLAGGVAVFLGIGALLGLMNTVYHGYFREADVVLASCYATALVVCLLEHWTPALAALLIVPLCLANGLINPLDRGLRVVTKSALYRAVQGDPQMRAAKWLVYSHDFTLTGFVVASGADVFNSFKVLPNLGAMAPFDPERRAVHSYNQSGHMVVRPLPEGQPSRFENPDVGLLRWSVSPLDPALRKAGIRYLVFDEPPEDAFVRGLRRIDSQVPNIYLYELP